MAEQEIQILVCLTPKPKLIVICFFSLQSVILVKVLKFKNPSFIDLNAEPDRL